ncbi:ligand-binding sensor domain-containing protein [Flavobacterium sp. TMP13]|uniref:ligand-binding sensor domain-containing protein n=1 Tax=Flavobacterium sp. TMP13 TaxID=3425950 RepID=UPI003D782B01
MLNQLRLLSFIFCYFLLNGTILYCQKDVLRFKRITSQQGLSENKVTAVFQGSGGTLWVGSKIAINRYDGEINKVYHLGRNNNINQFFEDSNKNIWIATQYGLYFYDKKMDKFLKIDSSNKKTNKLLNSNVTSVLESKKNELLISGQGDFLVKVKVDTKGQIVESSIKILNIPNKYGNVIKIEKGVDSRFWLATSRGEVLSIENDVVKESGFIKLASRLLINDISTDDFGNLWVATNGTGLFRYDTRNNTIEHFYKDTKEQSLNNNVVTKVFAEGKNVWLGTDGGGLNLYVQDKNNFNHYMYDFGNEFSISDNSITDIQQGQNNVILLGTVHGGVSILRNSYGVKNIPAINFKFLAQDPQGSRVLEDSNKNIWLSAGRSGLRRYNPTTKAVTMFSSKDPNSKFRGNIVLSLFEDHNKRLWIGTLREGLNVYDLTNNSFIDVPESKEFKGVFAITEDGDKNIWVGNRNGITIYNKDLAIVNKINLTKQATSNSNYVACLYKDVANCMWVGTNNGLFKFEKKGSSFVMSSYKHDESDSNSVISSDISSIGETFDYSVLIGTYGHGISKYDRKTGKFQKIINSDKIKGGIIRGILQDHQNNTWLSTNEGLTRIDLKNNIFNYGLNEGIFPFNGGAASLNSSGKILMAGVFGLSYFNLETFKDINYFPNVYFSAVKAVNGTTEKIYSYAELANDTVVIEPDNKLLNINFSSSELYLKNSVNYQYLIVGLSEVWQNLGSQNKISFTNLDPGKYQLRVRATNNTKLWGKEYTKLNIVIKPSFWQNPLVKAFFLLSIIFLIVMLYRFRTASTKKHRERLQRLLDLKTIEVQEQEQSISQSKISLLEIEKQNQVLKQKKLENELHFKIDELTNNTLRAMHKNNLLIDIKEKLKVELKNKIIDKSNLENIVDHINDSFILDADWESFYTLFNQVHPRFIKSLKQQYPSLSEREIRLGALILIDFSSQHIATLFGISLTSVKVARHRLRKKINIDNSKSVKQFMMDISTD